LLLLKGTLRLSRRTLIPPSPDDELEILREECLEELRRRARVSAVASALPVPGLDALTDIGLLMQILPDITARFGVSESELKRLDPRLAGVAFTTLRTLGPSLLGGALTRTVIVAMARRVGVRLTTKQVTRYVPLIGTAASALLGYSAFMAIGKRHVDQCVAVRRAIDGAGPVVADVPPSARGRKG
jgi:hypothetical protein